MTDGDASGTGPGAGERSLGGPLAAVRCPECGRPADDRSVPRPRGLLHWRRAVPAAVVLLVAGTIAVVAARSVTAFALGSGTYTGEILDPPITRRDLAAIASGERSSDGALVEAVRRLAERRDGGGPVPLQMGAAFAGPSPMVLTKVVKRGWPVPWITRQTTEWVDGDGDRRVMSTDPERRAVKGFGVSMAGDNTLPPRPAWEWVQGHLLLAPPPEAHGGTVVRTMIRPAALALPLAAAWSLMLVVAGSLLAVERLRRRRPLARRTRRRVFAVAGGLAIAGVVASLAPVTEASSRRVDRVVRLAGGRVVRTMGPGHAPVAVDLATLGQSGGDSEDPVAAGAADAALARAILAAVDTPAPGRTPPATPPSESDLLSVQITMAGRMDAAVQGVQSPLPLGRVSRVTWADAQGTPVAAPRGIHWRVDSTFLAIERSDGVATTPTFQIMVSLVDAGLVLLGIFAAGGTAGLAGRLVARGQVRRRNAAGICPDCGQPRGVPRAG